MRVRAQKKYGLPFLEQLERRSGQSQWSTVAFFQIGNFLNRKVLCEALKTHAKLSK